MTDGLRLEDFYGATIDRIKVQGGDKSRLGMGALMWISYAERPLRPNELCHALAIQLGSTDFNAGNIPSITTLVSCCQGLISVDKAGFRPRVRLIHFTLKEYFSAHPDIFSSPHSKMAEICLTYLNSEQVKALSANSSDLSDLIHDKPFLKYCSLYWGVHAKKELSDCARSLALNLLQEYDGHATIPFLVRHIGSLDLSDYSYTLSLSGVHCASFFGIVEIVDSLIEMQGYGTNRRYYLGNSPLALAARNGHMEVVEILLGRWEVDPDEPNEFGQTPLCYAAAYGHEAVVEILLGQAGVNPSRTDKFGRTPLSYVAGHGREGVMEILLEWVGADPNGADNEGRTLLSYAAEHGEERMVKILLRWERVDPDWPENSGRTPLSYAAENGREGVVKILLGREEVNPDKSDNCGRTPLLHAACWGQEEVVKRLLKREKVNPTSQIIAVEHRSRMPLNMGVRER